MAKNVVGFEVVMSGMVKLFFQVCGVIGYVIIGEYNCC